MDGNITRKPPLFIRIIGFIILSCFGLFIKSYFFNAKEQNKEEIIQRQLDSLNNTLPIVLDDFARLDTVFKTGKDGFKYCYTLIHVDEKSSEVFKEALEYKLKASSQENYDTNEEMKPFRDMDAKINYNYNDKNGYYLFDFTIRPTKNK